MDKNKSRGLGDTVAKITKVLKSLMILMLAMMEPILFMQKAGGL